MKTFRLLTIVLLVTIAQFTFAQSSSYQTLTDHFAGGEDVHSFKFSGFLCRTVLFMAGEWEFRDAISDVKSIRLITIPKVNLKDQNLTVRGFRKLLLEDRFEWLINVKDHKDLVEIYIQQSGNKKERYLVLVDEPGDLTVIELKGHIDIEKLKTKDGQLSYQGR